MVKYIGILLLLLFSPLVIAEVSSEQILQHLPGNWTVVLDVDIRKVKSVTTYNKNKTVQYNLSITKGKERFDHQGKGSWRVEGNTIIVEITESNADYYLQVGDILKYKVIHIDDKKLTYLDDHGTEATEKKF